ncbi:MAG: phosphate signaling complex PhoU family protein [Candidatus Dormibacteraceae bacterium]
MGDYAVRLARRSGILAEPPQHPLPPHFARMGELATAMVHDILTALADQDARRAREIAVRDEEIDHLYREVVDYLIGRGKPSPYIALRTVTLIQAAHDLERISDRVTNIAEDIIFWVEGEIVEL